VRHSIADRGGGVEYARGTHVEALVVEVAEDGKHLARRKEWVGDKGLMLIAVRHSRGAQIRLVESSMRRRDEVVTAGQVWCASRESSNLSHLPAGRLHSCVGQIRRIQSCDGNVSACDQRARH
jgi:hypothetical protein